MDNQNYVSDTLSSRNCVALPNRVWAIDIFQAPATLETEPNSQKPKDIKVLLVLDLATKETLLTDIFMVQNGGNIKSYLVCRAISKLFNSRGILDDQELLIHTDRGSEFTSNQFASLFTNGNKILSMSKPNTPTDNGVVERYVRTYKRQLIQAQGCTWPKTFKNQAHAQQFMELRRIYTNTVHVNRNNLGQTSQLLHNALESNKQQAPYVLLHWSEPKQNKGLKGISKKPIKDLITRKIMDYKRQSVQVQDATKGSSPEAVLRRTEKYAAVAAQGALEQPQRHADLVESLADIKKDVATILAEIASKPEKKNKKTKHLPLRDCADGSVYFYLMKLTRPKGHSRYVWSRNRIATTLLRWSGCRASDIARFTLKDLKQAIENGRFQVMQPKTKSTRIIVMSQRALIDIKAIQLDIAEVFGDDQTKPLASAYKSNKLLAEDLWVSALNKFIKPAKHHFDLELTSHSFRINYITYLLRTVPLQRVSKIVGHVNTNTTAIYDRYVIDPEQVKQTLNKLE